ncbi:MAG: hypothetical protein KC912_18130 [Proteobacteria bacterium]|nr:hypothetical protein [Pseudomonadota bacterium]
MRIALLLLVACSGTGSNDDSRLIDTSEPAALPVAGTYRAIFDGTYSACDLGIVNDRILSVRQQYVLVLPYDATEEDQLVVRNSQGEDLFDCTRDPSDGSYYCGEQFDQHIGDDSNTYGWTLVHRFVFDGEDTGKMTINSEVTCSGSSCPYETCEDDASYSVDVFLDFEQLNMAPCTAPGLPANALQESLIEVRNLNSQSVDLVWLNWTGGAVAQQTLSPGQTVRQRAYAGHPWQARIGNTCLGTWTATNKIGQFDVP